MQESSNFKILSAGLFIILTSLVLLTFRDYGVSWDERVQHEYGEKVVHFYSSLFKDRSSMFAGNLVNYGGAFEVLGVFATRLLPFGVYQSRHLVIALCGIGGVLACWRIVRLLAGCAPAFWAALLLSLYPSYYGHMFINSKDIPFAVLYAWSLYYVLRMLGELPDVSIKTAAKAGLVMGIAMGIRAGGLLLLCYLYAALLAYFLHFRLRNKASSARSLLTKMAAAAALSTAMAYGLMLIAWPYALSKPFIRPFTTLAWFSQVHGDGVPSPRTYIAEHLAVKLPEAVLVLLGVTIVMSVRGLFIQRSRENFSKTLSYALLALSSVFPLAYAAITRPYLYDEVRHFLFVIPPLFCIAGIALNHVVTGRKVLLSALGLYLIFHIGVLVRLHPYEYAYYNRLTGGLPGAYKRGYVTEYWATSYKEGVEQLRAYLQNRDGAAFEKTTYKIAVGPAEWCAMYYFPKNFIHVTDPTLADIYLSTTRSGYDDDYRGRELVAVERYGVRFVVAKQLD